MAQIAAPLIKTERVPISMITSEMFIEGHIHSKPGSYLSRVSDILNSTALHFIPITEARYRFKHQPDETHTSDCLVVNISEIKVVALSKSGGKAIVSSSTTTRL
jgi:hypothetical protein